MSKAKVVSSSGTGRKTRPAITIDAREQQLISYAIDLAEKQLIEGTASSQVITHYLKLGSSKERLEKEMMEKQKELLEAKTQNLRTLENQNELLEKAMKAFTSYQGRGDSDEY